MFIQPGNPQQKRLRGYATLLVYYLYIKRQLMIKSDFSTYGFNMIESFIVISGIIAFISALKEIKNIQIIFWIFILCLIVFDGLRWEMGVDWTNYFSYFSKAHVYDQPGFEYGFILYTSIIRNLTDNYSVYLLITTAFIYIGI